MKPRRRSSASWVLVLLVVLMLAIGGGAAVVVVLTEQQQVRAALRWWAKSFGLNPDYVDAIGKVEGPNWKLSARSKDPRDEARGGSFGPTQISMQTARAVGYAGDMEAFRRDAQLAAEWTGRILADVHWKKPLVTLADYVAAWNAGKNDGDANNDGALEELPATHPTRLTYLPAAQAALAYVLANPVPEGAA